MVSFFEESPSEVGLLQNVDEEFAFWVNSGVSSHLSSVIGIVALEAINFHLSKLVNVDLSEVATKPALVESGLRKLFGNGAQIIIKAIILAAFRSARIVPDRDFLSLQDAFVEMYSRARPTLRL